MINLQETKVGDYVWLEENGRSVLAIVNHIYPYPEQIGELADVKVLDYALIFENKFENLKKAIPAQNLTEAKNASAYLRFASACESGAISGIREQLGDSFPESAAYSIRSIIKHTVLNELRRGKTPL